jgi:hypothetical protein
MHSLAVHSGHITGCEAFGPVPLLEIEENWAMAPDED